MEGKELAPQVGLEPTTLRINSRTGYSHLALQAQVLRRAKTGFLRKLGGLWGDTSAFRQEATDRVQHTAADAVLLAARSIID